MVKNKVAPPFRIAEFDMMHNDGISYEGDVLDLAMEDKLVVRSGAWFRYGDLQLGQGREKARDYLKDNPAVAGRAEGQDRRRPRLRRCRPLEASPRDVRSGGRRIGQWSHRRE